MKQKYVHILAVLINLKASISGINNRATWSQLAAWCVFITRAFEKKKKGYNDGNDDDGAKWTRAEAAWKIYRAHVEGHVFTIYSLSSCEQIKS